MRGGAPPAAAICITQDHLDWVQAYLAEKESFWKPFMSSRTNAQYRNNYTQAETDLSVMASKDAPYESKSDIVLKYINMHSFRIFVQYRSTGLNSYWGHPDPRKLPPYNDEPYSAAQRYDGVQAESVSTSVKKRIKRLVTSVVNRVCTCLKSFEHTIHSLLQ